MFDSARQALKFAFGVINTPILKSSGINSMRGSSGNSDMTPHDRHAQAAMIMSIVGRAVNVNGMAYLKARFANELRGGSEAREVKEVLYRVVAAALPTGLHQRRGIDKMIEVYFGADYTMVSVRTDLRCNNRKYYEYKSCIYDVLDKVGKTADADVHRALDAAGLLNHEVVGA